MRPSNLTLVWRLVLVLGLCLALSHVLWILAYRVEGLYSGVRPEAIAGFELAGLVGWPLFAAALWKAGRGGERIRNRTHPGGLQFFPRVHWAFDLLTWTHLPIAIFSILVIAIVTRVWWLFLVPLLIAQLAFWGVLISIPRIRYEFSDAAFIVHGLSRQSIPWREIAGVRSVMGPFGEQFEIARTKGRPARIMCPEERDRFLAALRDRAPGATFVV